MKRFGGYKHLVLTEPYPPIPGLTFGQHQVAVYFRAIPSAADIITTWNRHFRTAAGIGPCSTIAEMKQAYGEPCSRHRTESRRTGRRCAQWVVGPNLMFATHDQRNDLRGSAVPRVAPQHGAQTIVGVGRTSSPRSRRPASRPARSRSST